MGHPLSPLSYPAPVGVEGETRTRKARRPTGSRPVASTVAPLRQRCRRGDSNSHWPEPPRSERGPSASCGTPACLKMEWQEGFEPSTSCMARRCSGRLSYYHMVGAEGGTRTRISSLEGTCAAVALLPHGSAGGEAAGRTHCPPRPHLLLFRGDIRLLRCRWS
jgi:hypothetical protein